MIFDTAHLKPHLRARSLHGLKYTFGAQLVRVGLQFVSLFVLARLIAPEEFGLFALAGAVIGIATALTEGGLAMATVQRETIDHRQVSALFWINLGLALLLLAAIARTAPWFARTMGMPGLAPALILMSCVLPLTGIGVQSQALLRRQMRFQEIARADVMSAAAGTVTAVALALAGHGLIGLVAMSLVAAALRSALLALSCRWLPGWPRRAAGLGPLLSFGAYLASADLLARAAASIMPFALGVFGTPAALGHYNRAQTITSLPASQLLPPVIAVAGPLLARVQDEPLRFRAATGTILRRVVLFSVLISSILFVGAEEIVRVALGPGWGDAVLYLRLLSAFAVIEPLAGTLAAAMTAAGAANTLFRARIVQVVLMLAGIAIGQLWGAVGVIAVVSISGLFVRLPVFFAFALARLPLSWRDVLEILGSGAAVFVALTLSMAGLKAAFPGASALTLLMLIALAALPVLAAGGWLLPVFRPDLRAIVHELGQRLRPALQEQSE